jgi:anti-sigma regulatory factor (Ser/Thr protein kinase)
MTAPGQPATLEDGAPHAVALYDSEESLRARVVPYVREGLDRGETVVAVVSDAAERILRSALRGDAGRVQWRAGEVSYDRLGAMFEGFRQFLADQRAAGVAMRLLTQNDVPGGPDRIGAYLRNEAMTNEVYRPYGYSWACLYDRRAHTEETLRQVREVHPRLLEPGGRSIPSAEYVTPGDFVARSARYLPVPEVVELDVELIGAGELVRLRRLLGRWADGHGVEGDDAHDVLIAVSEAVTNALQHGAPPVRVQAFTDGGVARVRVHDPGSAAVFATAGYYRPDPSGGSGIGLWVARQLADVVTTHTDTTGTTVELSFPMTGWP